MLCKECPAGSHQPLAGQSQCVACAAGSYQPLSRATSCLPCPSGSTTDTTGQLTCVPSSWQTLWYAVLGAVASGAVGLLFWYLQKRREARLRRERFGLAAMVADAAQASDDLGDFSSEDAISFLAGIRTVEDRLRTAGIVAAMLPAPALRGLAAQIALSLLQHCPPVVQSKCPSPDCCCSRQWLRSVLPYDAIPDAAPRIAADVVAQRAAAAAAAAALPAEELVDPIGARNGPAPARDLSRELHVSLLADVD